VLDEQMADRDALGLFADLEMPVAATLTVMEDAGIAVDDAVLAVRETELDAVDQHCVVGAHHQGSENDCHTQTLDASDNDFQICDRSVRAVPQAHRST